MKRRLIWICLCWVPLLLQGQVYNITRYSTAEGLQSQVRALLQDSKGYLTLSNRPIIAALVNAVKELKDENNELKIKIAELDAMKAQMTQLALTVQRLTAPKTTLVNPGKQRANLKSGSGLLHQN